MTLKFFVPYIPLTVYCAAHFMKLYRSKTRVNAFARKSNVLYYTCKLWKSSTNRTDKIKDVYVQLDSKLHFRAHVDCMCIFPNS